VPIQHWKPRPARGYRILVTGSRERHDRVIPYVLTLFCEPFTEGVTIVHGGASGVDKEAAAWAFRFGQEVEEHRADFRKYGKGAGPMRNREMVDAGADICLAFPDRNSVDTWDCVKRAHAAGIEVRVYPEPKR
jgi:hypothetical protein